VTSILKYWKPNTEIQFLNKDKILPSPEDAVETLKVAENI
jgi:hypothetical protein